MSDLSRWSKAREDAHHRFVRDACKSVMGRDPTPDELRGLGLHAFNAGFASGEQYASADQIQDLQNQVRSLTKANAEMREQLVNCFSQLNKNRPAPTY